MPLYELPGRDDKLTPRMSATTMVVEARGQSSRIISLAIQQRLLTL